MTLQVTVVLISPLITTVVHHKIDVIFVTVNEDTAQRSAEVSVLSEIIFAVTSVICNLQTPRELGICQ